ncbi:MAG TPA: MFS transporter [Gammaproteobacteria bacterium]|nr:MFS transporter [Gammaproteobacteria bacterium]
MRALLNRRVLAWACYDWANSAYATAVLAGFFPVFFKQYWSAQGGASALESTYQLGLANSLASVTIAILAPLLGTLADIGGMRRRFLLLFAALGIVMCAGLYFVAAGETLLALSLFILATIGFSGSVVFYDALIVTVAREADYDLVSALGYALGYLGGGLLFAVTVIMSLQPAWFGLTGTEEAVRVSFLIVAAWWLVFTLPLVRYVPDPPAESRERGLRLLGLGARRLAHTLRHIGRLPQVALFLLAYWLYIDGVDTIVRMAVDYGMSLGFAAAQLMVALLITQFVGFPAAIAFGMLGQRMGTRRAILLALAVYLAVTLWASIMDEVSEFYVLAVIVGLVQGGVQSLSRSFYARLIPAAMAAEFFGFYNMLGRFAAIFGPFMVGMVGMASGDARLGILSVAVLFLAGGGLLLMVRD